MSDFLIIWVDEAIIRLQKRIAVKNAVTLHYAFLFIYYIEEGYGLVQQLDRSRLSRDISLFVFSLASQVYSGSSLTLIGPLKTTRKSISFILSRGGLKINI